MSYPGYGTTLEDVLYRSGGHPVGIRWVSGGYPVGMGMSSGVDVGLTMRCLGRVTLCVAHNKASVETALSLTSGTPARCVVLTLAQGHHTIGVHVTNASSHQLLLSA
jgi:hypothetical protein